MSKVLFKQPDWNFITRTVNKLYDGDIEYRFAGANIGWLGIDFVPGGGFSYPPVSVLRTPSKWRVNDVFITAKMLGSNVVRMNPNVGGVGYSGGLYPALGVFDETVFRHIDYVIATARYYGIRLIFPFIDSNENYYWGSKAVFGKWGGTNFYTDSDSIDNFKVFIAGVINRVNTYNGLIYKNDPTILAWETVNEGNPPYSWTSVIAAYIKSLDSNHLVVDGKNPSIAGSFDPDNIADPNLDIMSDHFYPMDVSRLQDDLATADLDTKVFAVTEYDWPSTRAGGDSLTDFLAEIELHDEIKGSVFWNLASHDDVTGYAGYKQDYLIACPENAGLDLEYGRPSMQTKADQIRTHHFTFRKIGTQPCPYMDIPLITNSVGHLQWRGVPGAKYYHIQRSATDSGYVDVSTTINDTNSPWIDPDPLVGDSWYRIAAQNADGDLGDFTDGVLIDMKTWWNTDGAINCDMAYAPVGAVNYTASKINLVNPGLHNLTEGETPGWSTITGWSGNGVDKVLYCDYIPASQDETWIVKFNSYSYAGNYRMFGIVEGGQAISILPGYTDGNTYYDNGGYASPAKERPLIGVMAVAGNKAYFNGVDEGLTLDPLVVTFTHGIALLARYNSGLHIAEGFFLGNISSFCHYPSILTEAQISAIGALMP